MMTFGPATKKTIPPNRGLGGKRTGISDPTLRNELDAFAPSCCDGCLKPVFLEIDVVDHDDLEAAGMCDVKVVQSLEEIDDCCPIFVARPGRTFFHVCRIVSLGRLIEHKKTWNGPVSGEEEPVKTEVSGHVIADPVLATADLRERDRAIDGVGDDGELLPIETDALISVFEIELSGDLGHVERDKIESRNHTLLKRLGIKAALQLCHLCI